MKLLILEIWVYLLIAFLLGMLVQWFYCCRGHRKGVPDIAQDPQEASDSERFESQTKINNTSSRHHTDSTLDTSPSALINTTRPLSLAAGVDVNADDLKRIKGIGAVIEKTLNELGVFTFHQIADWDSENVAWVENHLAFPGRIGRENWLEQARTLAEGGKTDFSNRVDKGEVDYRKTNR